MKIVVIGLAVAAALSGCVTRTYERDTVVEQKSPPAAAVVVPQGATAPSSTTVVVPQSAPAPKSETTIVVPR
jgi:hypothetical protein